MFRSFRAPTHPFFIPMLLTLACGGGPTGSVHGATENGGAAGHDASDGEAGSTDADGEGGRSQPTPPSKGGRGGSNASAGASGTADAGSEAGGVSGDGAAGESGASGDGPPICVSTGSDDPDGEFVDSNCDGIDGDLTRAVFVSPDGSDGADGSLAQPLRHIDEAIELAAGSERDVYVCNGTYTETVTITTPIAIYGGYDCANGGRRTKDRAIVRPDRGLALSVQSVTGTVHVERLAFRSADAVSPGESSQAGRIVASSNVVLSRVEFSAGKGAEGAPGAPGADASQTRPFAGAPGANAPMTACRADAMTAACQVTPSGGFDPQLTQSCQRDGRLLTQRGGNGGNGANAWLALGRPQFFDTQSVTFGGQVGGHGSHFSGSTYASHHPSLASQPGSVGEAGADATHGFGSVVSGLYVPNNWGWNAKDGGPGYPGNGGSGGSSTTIGGELSSTQFYVGAGGGQGGVGGCGGKGAKGGGAGGGSIALVLENSVVAIELSQFITAAGGAGALGHVGGKGQPGGLAGAPGNSPTAATRPTAGGNGGNGGQGGDSGAGGGGPSIGVVYVGSAPAITETTYVIGEGGRGGLSVRNATVVNGISADMHAVTTAAPL
jgi:hypothetical protein